LSLDDFTNEIKKPNRKKNPITQAKKDEVKFKSIRIRPEDHKKLRYISLSQEKSYVDLIGEAIDILEQKYKQK